MELQCRACTSTTASEYMEFVSCLGADLSYLDYFNQLTLLEASVDDGLPNVFCTNCCHDLRVSYEFVQIAKQAAEAFKENQQQELIKAEGQEIVMDYIQEDEYQIDTPDHIHEEIVGLSEGENSQISIDSVQYMKNSNKTIEIGTIDEHQEAEVDIVAEEMLECQEDELNEESVQFDEMDMDTLEGIEGVEIPVEKLDEIIKDTEKYVEIMSNISTNEYYPEDENDDEYLIEYDPNDTKFLMKKDSAGEKWKCVECKKILRGDVSFEGHMNMHKDVHPYSCSQCQCMFRCKNSFQRHANLRHNEKSQSHVKRFCRYCRKRFQNPEDLQNHVCDALKAAEDPRPIPLKIMETEDGYAICPHCNIKLDKDCLTSHIRFNHPNEYRKEPEDFEESLESNNLIETENNFDCKFCDEHFTNGYEMRSHMREAHPERLGKDISHTGEPLEPCTLCGKKLLKRNMPKHMEYHQNPEERPSAKFICAYCSREFKNLKSLNSHEKTHKGEQPDIIYVCGECDRQYNSEHSLEQHRRQAHKDRDNVCNLCGNAFKLKNQLLNHMKLHLKRDIQCPHCDKKYARTFDLNVHMRTHTGEMPYQCHLCEKRFAIKVRLTYHLQKHYGIKHRCKDCGAEFNSKQKLKAHSFKHTGMPYICEMCNDHGFTNRDVFKRHLLRVHKKTMSDADLRAMFQKNTGKTTKIKTVDDMSLDLITSSLEEVEAS